MAEEIKSLIEKIRQEGILAAQKKAEEIELQAKAKAQEMIAAAKVQANRLVSDAKAKEDQFKKSSEEALKQSARDIMLSLRKEINAMLDKIAIAKIHEILTPSELSRIIAGLIKNIQSKDSGQIVISLSKEDLKKLEGTFLKEIKDEVKKDIILKPSEEVISGFIISYDSGRSCYDFSDKSLAEYIGTYLKPKLKGILENSTGE